MTFLRKLGAGALAAGLALGALAQERPAHVGMHPTPQAAIEEAVQAPAYGFGLSATDIQSAAESVSTVLGTPKFPLLLAHDIPYDWQNVKTFDSLKRLGMNAMMISPLGEHEMGPLSIEEIVKRNRHGLELANSVDEHDRRRYNFSILLSDPRLPPDVPDEEGPVRSAALASIDDIVVSYAGCPHSLSIAPTQGSYSIPCEGYANWMIFGVDEPSPEDLPRIARVAKAWVTRAPEQNPLIINTLPQFAFPLFAVWNNKPEYLNPNTYCNYINQIQRTIPVPFDLYDLYNWQTEENGGERISFYYDLLDRGSLSKVNQIPFVVVVQRTPHGWPWTGLMFEKLEKWQDYWLANLPMVAGAKSTVMFGIRQYADVPNDIFFGESVYLPGGIEHTEIYPRIKRLNEELRGPRFYLGRAEHLDWFVTGPRPPGPEWLPQSPKYAELFRIENVRMDYAGAGVEKPSFAIGIFQDGARKLIYVVNRDDTGAQFEGWAKVGADKKGRTYALSRFTKRGGVEGFWPYTECPTQCFENWRDEKNRVHFTEYIAPGRGLLVLVKE